MNQEIHKSFIITGPQIYLEEAIQKNGSICIEGSKLSAICDTNVKVYKFPQTYHLIPGFIDLQLHGAQGNNVMDATHKALSTLTHFLPSEGTTSFLACTMTETDQAIQKAMTCINEYCMTPYHGSEIIGVHLEGPFVAEKYVGAQRADAITNPNIELFSHWQNLSGNRIKMVTFAPELDHGLPFAEYLQVNKIINSFGHSDANYETACSNIKAGCTTATHLFNAMRGLHHRQPNAITALLNNEKITTQIIADGIHLHPAVINLIYKLKGKRNIALVTDAMPAKGNPDGDYLFGGQKVIVRDRQARLENGALAGSTITMLDAVLNMMKFTNISFAEALHMATCVPAKLLGIFDRKGSIAANKDADLVVLNEQYQVVMTVCRGVICYESIQ